MGTLTKYRLGKLCWEPGPKCYEAGEQGTERSCKIHNKNQGQQSHCDTNGSDISRQLPVLVKIFLS